MRVKLAFLLRVLFSCHSVFLGFVFAALQLFPYQQVRAQSTPIAIDPEFFRCSGPLELDVWKIWDEQAMGWANSQLIESRLKARGDSYALYDVEILFHNLLAMAQRCQRVDRQLQLAAIANSAYATLEVAPGGEKGRAWVCRGGNVCNTSNKLINTEVMLTSVQFLAFSASLANGINRQTLVEIPRNFVDETIAIASEHLIRWGNLQERMALRKRIQARPEDIKDGSSALFLTDKELWQISIYADLAGLLQAKNSSEAKPRFTADEFVVLKETLTLLLRLVNSRITTSHVSLNGSLKENLADLDAGFWRLYSTNKFASYSGSEKPMTCVPDADNPGKFKIINNLDASAIGVVKNIGWDISHARRLVHFFDALDRNRTAITNIFGIPASDMPSSEVFEAFARQLHVKVWNQDLQRPLFSNYFSGANGWYRVAYDNGTGQCVEGTPPYGLSDSFPTGGYIAWAAYIPGLQTLGEKLFQLTKSQALADTEFLTKYYPNLARKPRNTAAILAELMFWPSLIKE